MQILRQVHPPHAKQRVDGWRLPAHVSDVPTVGGGVQAVGDVEADMYSDPEALTPPERACQKRQVQEKRCHCCVHRRIDGMAFGETVLSCHQGRTWPPRGYCAGFELDLGDEK